MVCLEQMNNIARDEKQNWKIYAKNKCQHCLVDLERTNLMNSFAESLAFREESLGLRNALKCVFLLKTMFICKLSKYSV